MPVELTGSGADLSGTLGLPLGPQRGSCSPDLGIPEAQLLAVRLTGVPMTTAA